MTSKVDQMKDWSRKPCSEDKKYHSFISSDFQRDLPPLQNHAKTHGFSKIFLDALHWLVVRFAYQIKSKNSSRMVSKSSKNEPQSRFKTIVISTCFYKLPRTWFFTRFGVQNRPHPTRSHNRLKFLCCAWLSIKYGFQTESRPSLDHV